MPLTPLVDRLGRTFRGRNAMLNVFELWVGLAGMVTGAVFFYHRASIQTSAVDLAVGHEIAFAWNIGYFLAGILIWWGLLRPNATFEMAGLWGIGTSTAIQGIAVASIFGLRGIASASLLFALTAAAWSRATLVMHAALRLAPESGGACYGPD